MVESVELVRTGHALMAAVYVLLSLVAGVVAILVTMALTRRVLGRERLT
jgi:fluoride ion exporter CrcB/FEX